VAAFDDGEVKTFTVEPTQLGLQCCTPADLKGADAAANAAIAREIVAGGRGPKRDAVLLNAAAALVVARRAGDLREGLGQAAAALDDGRVGRLVDRLREASQR
jgi:anthranilate phosphoribosyltransferase